MAPSSWCISHCQERLVQLDKADALLVEIWKAIVENHHCHSQLLGGGFKNFLFHPYLGK